MLIDEPGSLDLMVNQDVARTHIAICNRPPPEELDGSKE
jgi:hypothetical protein